MSLSRRHFKMLQKQLLQRMAVSVAVKAVQVAVLLPVVMSFFTSRADAQLENRLQDDLYALIQSDEAVETREQQQLGSTMTLEQLQPGIKKGPDGRRVQPPKVETLVAAPAGEPTPALKYRFWIPAHERKPGSALLHFSRAQLLWMQIPPEMRNRWQNWATEHSNPTDEELEHAMTASQNIFGELHELSQSEDVEWDHRIRDLRGPNVYSYLLPDVQESRALARLLRLKIRYHLDRGEFDEAFAAITDGHHLAAFIGQGETLVQKLVGVACVAIMRDGIQQAIQTPGCPNLYWAMASVPHPVVSMRDAVDWEIHNISSVVPVLDQALSESWTEDEAMKRLSATLDDLQMLTGSGSNSDGIQVAISLATVSGADSARDRLLANGIPEDRVKAMSGVQAVLAEAAIELRRIGDDLHKGHLLPARESREVLDRETQEFNQWVSQNRLKSIGTVIASVLFPAVHRAQEAETRMLMWHNRLMTVEALRMHAASHGGKLPESLSKVSPFPAIPDPYTGQPFVYKVNVDGAMPIAELTSVMPDYRNRFGVMRLQLQSK